MILSMTAFASMQQQIGAHVLSWEIKSLNHRYLDVSFRLPDPFRALETKFRTLIRDSLQRGKVECQLRWDVKSNDIQSIEIDNYLIENLLDVSNQLAKKKNLTNDLTLSFLLNWPGVVKLAQFDNDILFSQAEQLFKKTLNQLIAGRKAEGQSLCSHLQTRLDKLNHETVKAEALTVSLMGNMRGKLLKRLNDLKLEIDQARIEQELAILVSRIDVSEEIDRLKIHLQEVGAIFMQKNATGRRLDFLMQELNREANTLGAKSDSIALTKCVIEMKVLIEQMREQIQNVE